MVILIHNAQGELVAYCGRYPADEPPEGEPKYRLPAGFRKEPELFNLHRVPGNGPDLLVVVESYLSAIRLHRYGYCVVSPMGRSISPQQVGLIASLHFKSIAVMSDGDEPGRAGALSVCAALHATDAWVRNVQVPEGFKPHRAREGEISEVFYFKAT